MDTTYLGLSSDLLSESSGGPVVKTYTYTPSGERLSQTTDPFTGNRYTFDAGNPVTNIELDGHMACAGPGGPCGRSRQSSTTTARPRIPCRAAHPPRHPRCRRHPAYLEASSLHNRRLYLTHGYCDHGHPIHLPGGPHMYPMWRKPQR